MMTSYRSISFTTSFCLLAFTIVAVPVAVLSAPCPPEGFDSLEDFDLDSYLGTWYVQEQMAVVYQPEENLFCVRAQYEKIDDSTIRVINYANEDMVNGEPSGAELRGIVIDNSKLAVGPDLRLFNFLAEYIYGPYWVLAAGRRPRHVDGHHDEGHDDESLGPYDWALISGGPPTIEEGDSCRTGRGLNGSGLWIFSRQEVAEKEEVDFVRTIAEQMGFNTTVLLPVEQKNCLYED